MRLIYNKPISLKEPRASFPGRWSFVLGFAVALAPFILEGFLWFELISHFDRFFFYLIWTACLVEYLEISKKVPALYLRRFGLSIANESVIAALERTLGVRYRVIALDDSNFTEIGVPKVTRKIIKVLGIAILSIGIILWAHYSAKWFASYTDPSAWTRSAAMFLRTGGMSFYFERLSVMFSFLFGLMTFFLLLIFLVLIHKTSGQKVFRKSDLSKLKDRIEMLSSLMLRPGIFAPQTTVVLAKDKYWKLTVEMLSRQVGAIILDISVPTENLIWELEQCTKISSSKIILIGEKRLLMEWSSSDEGWASELLAREEKTKAKMMQLIKDRTILVYNPGDQKTSLFFAQNLHRLLDYKTGHWFWSNPDFFQRLRISGKALGLVVLQLFSSAFLGFGLMLVFVKLIGWVGA